MGYPLVLALLLCSLHRARAGEPDVFPDEDVVPQCITLDVFWSEPPPIHLHVQPGSLINVTNLVDLGPQLTNTFTTFQVALPIGQKFTFAYNTIAKPFTVFVSRPMEVGPGKTDCLPGQSTSESLSTAPSPPPPPPPPSTSPPSTTTVTPIVPPPTTHSVSSAPSSSIPSSSAPSSSAPNSSASSAPTSGFMTSTVPTSPQSDFTQSASPSNSNVVAGAAKTFPVGPVVGSILAVAAAILVGIAVLWYCHRRRQSMPLSPNLQPVPTHIPAASPNMSAADIHQAPAVSMDPGHLRGPFTPAAYQESFSTHSLTPTKSSLMEGNTSSAGPAAGETRTTISGSVSGIGSPQYLARFSTSEEMPPAYH
ncbi:hypothetical protein DFH09DRAFT_215064 [Mycena vulgaris]|nr:hypothetical protein DFH09DRAFT_215064 [Mycena vulgaris]